MSTAAAVIKVQLSDYSICVEGLSNDQCFISRVLGGILT